MEMHKERRTPNNEYRLENGLYVFYMDGEPLFSTTTVSIGFDSSCGTLLKHGMDEIVSPTIVKTAEAFRKGGLNREADALLVINGRFPVHELNKVINHTGYISSFFEKLKANQLDTVA